MEIEQKKDYVLTCVDCGKDFILQLEELEYYRKKGLFTPKRCPACRKIRREIARAVHDGK